MSRFGESAVFRYASGDTIVGGTYINLGLGQMPTYPVESFNESDMTQYTSRTGKIWAYQNYSARGYTFTWANLPETTRTSLKSMYDSCPLFTFTSAGTLWGTFRMQPDSWSDAETSYELFDVSFTFVETL